MVSNTTFDNLCAATLLPNETTLVQNFNGRTLNEDKPEDSPAFLSQNTTPQVAFMNLVTLLCKHDQGFSPKRRRLGTEVALCSSEKSRLLS